MNINVKNLKPFNWRQTLQQKISNDAQNNIARAVKNSNLETATVQLTEHLEELKNTKMAKNEAVDFLTDSYGISEHLTNNLCVMDLVNFLDLPGVLFAGHLLKTRKFGNSMSVADKTSRNIYQIIVRAEDLLALGIDEVGDRFQAMHSYFGLNSYVIYMAIDNLLENGKLSEANRALLVEMCDVPMGQRTWKQAIEPLTFKADVADVNSIYLTHDFATYTDWHSRLHVPACFIKDDGTVLVIEMDESRYDEVKKAVDRLEKWTDKLVELGYISTEKALLYMKQLHVFHMTDAKYDAWFQEKTVDTIIEELDEMFEKKDYNMKKYIYEIVRKVKYGELMQNLSK